MSSRIITTLHKMGPTRSTPPSVYLGTIRPVSTHAASQCTVAYRTSSVGTVTRSPRNLNCPRTSIASFLRCKNAVHQQRQTQRAARCQGCLACPRYFWLPAVYRKNCQQQAHHQPRRHRCPTVQRRRSDIRGHRPTARLRCHIPKRRHHLSLQQHGYMWAL